MSLNFDYSKVPFDITHPLLSDQEEIAYYRKHKRVHGRKVIDNGDDDFRIFSPKTEQLIWLTMSVGIGRITEKTWEKFYRRSFVWQRVNDHDILVTAKDVYDHIGLSTNADSLTDSKFVKKLMRAVENESEAGIWLVKRDLNNKED